jgi:hypothetical protein
VTSVHFLESMAVGKGDGFSKDGPVRIACESLSLLGVRGIDAAIFKQSSINAGQVLHGVFR